MSVHMMNVEVAELAGVNAGLIFQSFSYWIDKNAANRRHFHDGLYWTYNSAAAFAEQFPYMSAKTVRSAIDKLIEAGLIIKGNYSKSSYDRTTWYAITEKGMQYVDLPNKGKWTAPEEKTDAPNGKMDLPERANASSQKGKWICPNGKMDLPERANGFAQMGKSIRGTDIVPDTVLTNTVPDTIPPYPPVGGTGASSVNPSADENTKTKRKAVKVTEPLSADEQQALSAFSPSLHDAVNRWLDYKAEKKQAYTSRGRNALLTTIQQNAAKFGEGAVITLINAAMANNWQGITWDRISQSQRAYYGGGYGNRQPPSRHVDENGHFRYNPGDTSRSL